MPNFNFGILLSLVAIVSAASGLLWLYRLPRRGDASKAVCGHCHYNVQNLIGWTCPECGSDVRCVGILTPQLRKLRFIGTLNIGFFWTMIMAASGWLVATQAPRYFPDSLCPARYETYYEFDAPSRLFDKMQISSVATARSSTFRNVTMEITVSVPNGSASYGHRLGATFGERPEWFYFDQHGNKVRTPKAMTNTDLTNWFHLIGAKPDQRGKQAEIDEAFAVIDELRTRPANSYNIATTSLHRIASSFGSTFAPPDAFKLFTILISVLVWALGAWFIFKRMKARRHLTPSPQHPSPSPASPDTAPAPPESP